MSPQRPHLLFIQPSDAPFVLTDLDILTQKYRVRARHFHFKPIWRHVWNQIAQMVWLLRHLHQTDMVYAWFADFHTVLPVAVCRITHKPIVIVLGGYDVAQLPELRYGAHLGKFRSFCSRITLRYASLLLPVSQATAGELAAFAPHAMAVVVPNGVDTTTFDYDPNNERDIEVLTVCGARDIRSARIKGIDLFVDVARRLPEASFLVIGLEAEALAWVRSLDAPKNITLSGRVSREALARLYGRTRVYCQFSRHESFGMALAEAMASGCLPVVTTTGALPEVTGPSGWISADRDAAFLAAAVQEALHSGPKERHEARQRILNHFSIEKRREALTALLSGFFPPEQDIIHSPGKI